MSGQNRNFVLAAMVFAVGMTFIDQTIVAIAIPNIQRELSLTATGAQWVINGYLLALSALFALGGKLGDVLGRRRMVVIGVIGFAIASACCGFTPKGSIAQAWIISFRVLQGAAAALLFPAAVGIVVAAYPLRERGRAMAVFFGIAGGLTAIGPIAGGYLTQWTWRSIFWINVPVAIIALLMIRKGCEETPRRQVRLDYRGTALITGAMGLLVLGFEQSSVWGWSSVATWACLIVGALLMLGFVRWELRVPEPLLQLRIFADRGFSADTAALGLTSVVFVPFFFFASIYSQVSLGKTSTQAGLYLLYFFLGFVILSQLGGRILDRRGARPAIVFGTAISAVGFYLLAGKLTDLSLSHQWIYVMIAGGGIGLMLTPASTDAVNRAPSTSYSEVTGITQTARNFGASLGLAVLGAILIHQNDHNITGALTNHGVPSGIAHRVAASFGAAPPAPDRLRASRTRSYTPSSSRSHTQPRPSSTSWPASWPRRSWSRSDSSHGNVWPKSWTASRSPSSKSRPSPSDSTSAAPTEQEHSMTTHTTSPTTSTDQLTTKTSRLSVADAVAGLTEIIANRGLKLFAVIDHSGEARATGLELRDTKVVIFGSPEAGTPVMQSAPLAALDLPLKVLVWSDGNETKLTYTDPAALATRYRLSDELAARLAGIDKVTDAVIG